MFTKVYARNEVKIWIKGQMKQSYHSCMQHSTLTCSIILPSTIRIFLMVAELQSEHENEVKIWIRGHNQK